MKKPYIEDSVVKYLESIYKPEEYVPNETTIEKIAYDAGVQSVIKHLKSLNDKQQN